MKLFSENFEKIVMKLTRSNFAGKLLTDVEEMFKNLIKF